MPSIDLILLAAFAATMLVYTGAGRLQLMMAAAIVSMFIFPRTIWGLTSADLARVGIAGAQPRITLYTLAAVLIITLAYSQRAPNLWWTPVVPLLMYLAFAAAFSWQVTSEVRAGIVHLATSAIIFVTGTAVALEVSRQSEGRQIVGKWLAGLVAFQSILCVLQWTGVTVFALDTNVIDDPTLVGRAAGTFGHPSTIGKMMVLVLILALPYVLDDDPGLRRLGRIASVLTLLPLVLSGGRANAAAAVALIVIFSVLVSARGRWELRIALVFGLLVTAASSYSVWAQRFQTGENGRFRGRFEQVAFDFLQHSDLVTGTGANTYITAVGPTDPLTALGWPVHNFFLLTAVEIGIVGTIALTVPFLTSAVVGWRSRSVGGATGLQASAILAGFFALLPILLTGWGMLSESLMPWMFVLGYASQFVRLRVGTTEIERPTGAGTTPKTSARKAD